MKPWKRITFRSLAVGISTLQWGHGDEAVEEVHPQCQVSQEESLQWGHGDEAVEEAGIRR